jgi:lipoprotein-anchoring transpeptidase ErfK/SrfK
MTREPADQARLDAERPAISRATAAPRRPAARRIAVLRPGHTVVIRDRPGGRVVGQMAVTPFGSRVTFPVLARRGRWAGVPAVQAGNGRLGWIDARSRALSWTRTRKTIVIDLVRRRLELRQGPHILLAGRVGVGAPGSPTPTGRFAITDRLSGPRFSAAYGCCILALSGHQTHLPAGWHGGDRLAIHGTSAPSTIGQAATTGCLHASDALMRALMRRVPLGTPVIIRR